MVVDDLLLLCYSTEERLDLVELLLGDIGLRQCLMGDNLNFMPDFLHLAKKFEQMKGSLQVCMSWCICVPYFTLCVFSTQDCVGIYQALMRLPGLISVLSGYHGKHEVLLEQLFAIPLKVGS